MSEPALQLDAVKSGYGDSIVVQGVSLDVRPGEVLALLGKNGMGKSTLLKTVMGFLPLAEGSVRLFGKDASGLPPHLIARRDIAYIPQEQALFQDLSVRENLRLGVARDAMLERGMERVRAVFPFLLDRQRQPVGTLSGGEQKMLLVARALISNPKLMLVDEISEGLQPSVIDRLAGVIREELRERGVAVLLVEQNVRFALSVATRFAVLKLGEVSDRGMAGDPALESRIASQLSV